MSFVKRASITECGAMTFTGNALGLSQKQDLNEAGTVHSIGAFISLDDTLQVPTFPVEAGVGTTLDWEKNGSRAILKIPSDSTILYAELIWGGNYKSRDQDIKADLGTQVKLTTPIGNYQIIPDPITAGQYTYDQNVNDYRGFYIRSADVTLLVKNGGAGTYSVEGVPGLIGPADSDETNHAGWTLAVIYKNKSMVVRNMTLYVGAQGIVTDKTGGQLTQDITISGFRTPATGSVTGRLLISAGEGDAPVKGDQLLFGADTGSLVDQSGPNNPNNPAPGGNVNFFCSQINGDDGELDTTGSYGDRNQDPAGVNIVAGRQGWDITNIDVSAQLANGQTSAVVRMTSTGDSYMPNSVGIQIDSTPTIKLTKQVDNGFPNREEIITYTLLLENTGQLDVTDIILTDFLPTGLTFIPGTFTVDGMVVNSVDLETGVNIGDLATNSSKIISFNVQVNDDKTLCGTTLTNQATVEYEYGCSGQSDITTSNEVDVEITCVRLDVVKTVDTDIAFMGDTVTFTVTMTNNGETTLDDVIFIDQIPTNTTFVPQSVTVNDLPKYTANPADGILLGTIEPGDIVKVSFSVTVNKMGCPLSIENKAIVHYLYTVAGTVRTGVEESNLVTIPIAPSTFKQLSRSEKLMIPSYKPDAEEILNTLVDIEIVRTKILNTISGKSEEGQTLTGRKLLIEGRLNQKVEYIAADAEQSVHSAHFKVPFSTYIILPTDFVEGTEVQVEAYVEDIYTKLINCRTIFKNVTFRLLAKQVKEN